MSPIPSASSARAAREAVARRLHELRLDAEMTGVELAARCGWSKSKSSRIENGKTLPSAADIRLWCAACGAADEAPDLVAASRAADAMYVQWNRLQRTGLRRLQESGMQLYRDTRLFRVYCSNVVPGLLQTPEYTRALLASIARFHGTPDDVRDAVAARMKRSSVVRSNGLRFTALIEEAVLYCRIGSQAVMLDQLSHLRAMMMLPSVSLGVIPSNARRPMWPIETFTVFDDERVHVEPLTAAITITQPSEVTLYVQAFGELQALAAYGDEARNTIDRACDSIRPHGVSGVR
jgi:transcriptional regulator with XRE-family HTH domain